MSGTDLYDAVIVGGGPSGATAAADLAGYGRRVLLLDRAGRIKPCGGAIPPRLVRDFAIPEHLLVAKARGARIIAPSDKQADMPIDSAGYVAMVDREHFDEWLRDRAVAAGAERVTGTYDRITHDEDGVAVVHFAPKGEAGERAACPHPRGDRRGRRPLRHRQAARQGRRPGALRVRLPRDRPHPAG